MGAGSRTGIAFNRWGISSFPLLDRILRPDPSLEWQMNPAEQLVLNALLRELQPSVSIEVGTYKGGSLQLLSRYSDRVISIDANPEVAKALSGRFSNVSYITGNSSTLLPFWINASKSYGQLEFVLIDGDHSTDGVKSDIECFLGPTPPPCPLYILMHDSLIPECREGIRFADWASNVYVHAVDLDFMLSHPCDIGPIGGGFALAIMLPEPRTGDLRICRSY